MIDPHTLTMDYLLPALIIFTLLVAYVFGIRPVLKTNPAFKDLYSVESGVFAAISAKLSGLKQRLTTVLMSAAGFIVLTYDSVPPLLAQFGITIEPAKYLPNMPPWGWVLLVMVGYWAMQYFRHLADKAARANAEALLNAGQPLAAPAPGLPVNTLPSPLPQKVS
jgi:hypothetical protein